MSEKYTYTSNNLQPNDEGYFRGRVGTREESDGGGFADFEKYAKTDPRLARIKEQMEVASANGRRLDDKDRQEIARMVNAYIAEDRVTEALRAKAAAERKTDDDWREYMQNRHDVDAELGETAGGGNPTTVASGEKTGAQGDGKVPGQAVEPVAEPVVEPAAVPEREEPPVAPEREEPEGVMIPAEKVREYGEMWKGMDVGEKMRLLSNGSETDRILDAWVDINDEELGRDVWGALSEREQARYREGGDLAGTALGELVRRGRVGAEASAATEGDDGGESGKKSALEKMRERTWKSLKRITAWVLLTAGVLTLTADSIRRAEAAAAPTEKTEMEEKYEGEMPSEVAESLLLGATEGAEVAEVATEKLLKTDAQEGGGERIWGTEYSREADPYYDSMKEKQSSWGRNEYADYDWGGLYGMDEGEEREKVLEGMFQRRLEGMAKSPVKAYSAMRLTQKYFGDTYFAGGIAEGNELARKVMRGEVSYDTINDFLNAMDEAVVKVEVVALAGDFSSDYARVLADGSYEAGYDEYVRNHGGHMLVGYDKDGIVVFAARLECGGGGNDIELIEVQTELPPDVTVPVDSEEPPEEPSVPPTVPPEVPPQTPDTPPMPPVPPSTPPSVPPYIPPSTPPGLEGKDVSLTPDVVVDTGEGRAQGETVTEVHTDEETDAAPENTGGAAVVNEGSAEEEEHEKILEGDTEVSEGDGGELERADEVPVDNAPRGGEDNQALLNVARNEAANQQQGGTN